MNGRSFTELAMEHPTYVWVLVLACIVGGLVGVDRIARLEDPPYPIKQAYVFTQYPGASALEVEQEVTEVLEASLQELPWVEKLVSRSLAGRSEIEIELYRTVAADDAPQIWDELRRRVGEAARSLPPGASPPRVEDDFADVYGILYAVTIPEGYRVADIRDAARLLQVGLKNVDHVGKVQVDGVPQERIYIEFNYNRLVRLGLPLSHIVDELNSESALNPGSHIRIGDRRLYTATVSEFERAEALEDIRIARPGSTEAIRLGEIASINRGETDLPDLLIHHDGRRVFTVGVSIAETVNVAHIGLDVEHRIHELERLLPLGMEVIPVYEQHRVVDESVNEFLFNLTASVSTVVAALCLFMGWRAGIVVGSVLLLTVLGTISVMAALGIQLHRISLGAMMIAMGMLVDNAIVIAEAMITGIQKGLPEREAAIDSVEHTRFPLLGATIIGMAAFAPIGLSSDSTGQFLGSLFHVSSVALFLSWLLAITIVPMLGSRLLKQVDRPRTEQEIYGGRAYRSYRATLERLLRFRYMTCTALLAIVALSAWGFSTLKQGFFPTTNTPLFFVDLNMAQGTDIHVTEDTVRRAEQLLSANDAVVSTTSWTGRGPSRFTMILLPERPNPSYAQVVVRVQDVAQMDEVISWSRDRLSEHMPDVRLMFRRTEFTTGSATKIEARFSGPDTVTLRTLGESAMQVYLAHGLIDRSLDWHERELALIPAFDEARARLLGVDRTDVANSLAFATNGIQVGLLRDEDKLVPMIVRSDQHDPGLDQFSDQLIWSEGQQRYIPVRQVVPRVELRPVDGIIMRRNRVRTLTARANAPPGTQAATAFRNIRSDIESIPLPPGYRLEWGGEYEANQIANQSVGIKFPIALGVMVLTTLLILGRIRQTAVIWLSVPLVLCGATLALHATRLSFTFPALLGLLSLVGILIKNSVVLVEEIDYRLAHEHKGFFPAILSACVSRLRPVMLAAGTTIAGMAPLLNDSFFREMAVTIMGGLALGSLLSLISVPIFYAVLHPRRGRVGHQTLSELNGCGTSG